MKSMDVTRRQFLKGTGALIVSFNLFPSLPSVFAQSNLLPNGELDPAQLDSWLAIAQDGTVTLFTSKVDLGTGIETALAQIAAEELDVSWKQIKVIRATPRSPSTNRPPAAAALLNAPARRSAKRRPLPGKSSCVSPRQDWALTQTN